MKRLPPLLFLACTLAMASPASAKTSLNQAIKLCKAKIATMTPPPPSSRVDRNSAGVSETHLWLTFKYKDADGRLSKLVCKVDREAQTAELNLE